MRATRRRTAIALILVVFALVVGVAWAPRNAASLPAASAAPVPVVIGASGANGEGRIETPGRRCADGGDGAYWNYDYGAALAGGLFSALPGELRLHLALHSDEVRFPNSGLPVAGAGAFLQGDESFAVLANDRGTVKLRLRSGDCDDHTLGFDGITAAGAGAWLVDAGQGAYRDVSGSGSFTFTADVAPGADNPFDVALTGSLAVLQPTFDIEVVDTFWGGLGTDYVTRRPTVVFKITNTGPGDAFGAKVAQISSSTPGVAAINTQAGLALGDLAAGDSEFVATRFQLGLLQPCQLVVLGCVFSTTTRISWADALDVVTTPQLSRPATAPNLPPPL
ncbi:hypothetical protein BH20ACT2_BH20ACT2_10740 [soil metagenome]